MSKSSEITISVSDPVKCSDKFGQVFITYKITSTSNRTGFLTGSITVVRRYSDFSWLSGELSSEFPGVIVPPLPEKQTVGRFDSEFVESRRRSLEKFLQRISLHHEVGHSHHFVAFLQADDGAMARTKADAKASKPQLASKAMAWFEGTVNNIANGKAEVEKSAADMKIEEISQYISAIEKQMVSVTKSCETLVRRSRETSTALFDFGQSISALGVAEGNAIGTALTQVGTTSDGQSVSASNHAEQQAIKLLEPFEEYARMLVCIKHAIQQRADKKSAFLSSVADLESKRAAYGKVHGVPGKESQSSAKEAAVQIASDASDTAKLEYEKVSERLLTEFELFKSQKAVDMKEIILNFVTIEIEYNQAAKNAWDDLLPKIEAIIVDSSGGGASNPFKNDTGGYEDFASVSRNQNNHNQQQQSSNPYHQSDFREEEGDDDMVGV